MSDILNALANSPLLAVVGLVVVLAVILAPAALSIAGLSGSQIIELLKATMAFIVEVIKEFRSNNKSPPSI